MTTTTLTGNLGNPHSCEWGNMSWGHATSRDSLHWTRMPKQPALEPDQTYDCDGVFTGCFIPPPSIKSDQLTVCYSSVCKLPFHWYTLPYQRDAAGIALATSTDGGMTWTKSPKNPVLRGAPPGLDVTGFRDPYVAPWPALDKLRGSADANLYALVSGGIRGIGPTTFLYVVRQDNPIDWEYLGPLIALPERFCPSKTLEANFGMNWECTNFMTLGDGSCLRHFLVLGAEGDVERSHVTAIDPPDGAISRTVRQQLWMCGGLQKTNDRTEMIYKYGGFLDHGSYYAANSFHDPQSGNRVVHGWIPEEDCTPQFAAEKGWNGSLALPREVFLLTIPNVIKSLKTSLGKLPSIEAEEHNHGFWVIRTLGIKPLEQLKSLRGHCTSSMESGRIPIPALHYAKSIVTFSKPSWELEANIQLGEDCQAFTLDVRDRDSFLTRFRFVFDLEHETMTLYRQHAGLSGSFNGHPERGHFTLFYTHDPASGKLVLEPLRLRIFLDADVLEVFANERFALATMVYLDQNRRLMDVVPSVIQAAEASVTAEIRAWEGFESLMSRVST